MQVVLYLPPLRSRFLPMPSTQCTESSCDVVEHSMWIGGHGFPAQSTLVSVYLSVPDTRPRVYVPSEHRFEADQRLRHNTLQTREKAEGRTRHNTLNSEEPLLFSRRYPANQHVGPHGGCCRWSWCHGVFALPECSLCDGLKEKLGALLEIAKFFPNSVSGATLEVRDITSNDVWFQKYQYEIPVLTRANLDGTDEELIPRASPRINAQMLDGFLAKQFAKLEERKAKNAGSK
mmetsp:Transcript_11790/g.22435  ORF Transcript_11790/g.22435 Transcript_11790/m.22435 type:complete len:233 (+) Transcript_11790:639-1337(+)